MSPQGWTWLVVIFLVIGAIGAIKYWPRNKD
jgi:hypothetical protein